MSTDKQPLDIHGDFQTPVQLAEEVWRGLGNLAEVGAVIEPTVGLGAFLKSAPDLLLRCPWLCFDIEPKYVSRATAVAKGRGLARARVGQADAFTLSADSLARLDRDRALLAIGNPPWVTSAGQGRSTVQNLPAKTNARFGLMGLDAMTGKANFDIAEAILLRLLEATAAFRDVRIAFLVKRTVAMKLARRLLGSCHELAFSRIDSAAHFNVAVDAGLFVAHRTDGTPPTDRIAVSEKLGEPPARWAGFRDDRFVEDLDAHAESAHLEATEPVPWRQGVKHDVAKILELTETEEGLVNGLGETVAVEAEALCPLYKSSDLANGRESRRLFPLFQRDLSGPVPTLGVQWPLLAGYLSEHAPTFAARRSRIYAGKPPFSIFGIGPYTLAPWKVAVSGMYSSANFRVIGPSANGQPSLVDDTAYLLPFGNESDARMVAEHLNDRGPQELIRSLMDPGAKRPITKALLSRLDIPLRPTEDLGDSHPEKLSLVA